MEHTDLIETHQAKPVHLGIRTYIYNIQGDQKVFVHLMIAVQKQAKKVLNSFNHLP
jgi:hypothetical protein